MTNKKFLIILSLLAVLAVVSGCVKKEPQNNQTQSQEQNQAIQEPAAAETDNIEIDTSDWQTYQNEENDFQFKYPDDCTINESTEMAGFDQGKKYGVSVVCGESNIFEINYLSNDFQQGIEEGCCFNYADEPIDVELSENVLLQKLTKLNPSNIEKIEINGKTAIKFFSKRSYTTDWVDEVYIIPYYGEKYSNIIITSPTVIQLRSNEIVDLNSLNLADNNNFKEFKNIIDSLEFEN